MCNRQDVAKSITLVSAVDQAIMVVDMVVAAVVVVVAVINIIDIMIHAIIVVHHQHFGHVKAVTFHKGHANVWDHQKVYQCQ